MGKLWIDNRGSRVRITWWGGTPSILKCKHQLSSIAFWQKFKVFSWIYLISKRSRHFGLHHTMAINSIQDFQSLEFIWKLIYSKNNTFISVSFQIKAISLKPTAWIWSYNQSSVDEYSVAHMQSNVDIICIKELNKANPSCNLGSSFPTVLKWWTIVNQRNHKAFTFILVLHSRIKFEIFQFADKAE